MATYSKSTGSIIKRVDSVVSYNVKTVVYTVPVGKMAVISQTVARMAATGAGILTAYYDRLAHGDAAIEIGVGSTAINSSSGGWVYLYTNTLTLAGGVNSISSNLASGAFTSVDDGHRVLFAGESFSVKQTGSTSNMNIGVIVEEFSPQT